MRPPGAIGRRCRYPASRRSLAPGHLSVTGNEGHYPPGHLNVQVAEAPLFDVVPLAPPLRSAAEGHAEGRDQLVRAKRALGNPVRGRLRSFGIRLPSR
jgi:hypothetical protein